MYRDTNGNEWDTAEEAIDEFVKNLPYLTGEDEHRVFQGTVYNATAEWNLDRIHNNIAKHPHLTARFTGDNYPVPFKVPVVDENTGIDLNVWNATLYGDRPVKCVAITGYLMTRNQVTGYWETDTDKILFSIDTTLPTDQWDDHWYGISADTLPHELPPEVLELVRPYLKEPSRES